MTPTPPALDAVPDSTAVRTAMWRALHVQLDPHLHVFEDEIGLKLSAPADGWRDRQDMHPEWTRGFRAAIVARARFIEDLVGPASTVERRGLPGRDDVTMSPGSKRGTRRR